MASPSSPYHKLANPSSWVRNALGILRRESLIIVFMSGQHDIRTKIIQCLPEWLHATVATMYRTRTKAWMMPVCQCAGDSMCSKILSKPLLLCRARIHRDVAIQRDDVPVTQVITVITFSKLTCCR